MIAGTIVLRVAFRNCEPFIKCIKKIDGTTIYDAEDLGLVMPMYNLLEYSSNYSDTTGKLWLYSKHEATYLNADIAHTNNFKSFKYQAKLIGSTAPANGILENGTTDVHFKTSK